MDDTHPIVLPVRFSGGGLTMQSTTGRISSEGVFVRCLVSPRQGSQMTLQLILPGERLPLQLTGTLAEVVTGGTPGFWVRFNPLDDGSRARLNALLSRRRTVQPPPHLPIERDVEPPGSRRSFARLTTKLRVSWGSARAFLDAWSENISRGGVFVATQTPPPLRSVVDLHLELPDGEPPARTQAEVVQRTTPEEAKGSGRVAGAGLQFIGGDDEFRRRLDECIEKLLKRK
jgi:uncharacterized protein (TIGR02266 family)